MIVWSMQISVGSRGGDGGVGWGGDGGVGGVGDGVHSEKAGA